MLIQHDVPLAPHTTLRIGGPARFFAVIRTGDDLLEALRFADNSNHPVFILGGGSNLLVSDSGFPGLVLKIELGSAIKQHSNQLQVDAGVDWDALVLHTCQQGLFGLECLAGIPGLVGGAPIQNIGAYGQEAGERIASVRAYDRQTSQFVELPRSALAFAYRRSIFNSTHAGRYIVTRVDFALEAQTTPNLTYPDLKNHFTHAPTALEVYHAVRAIRDAKGMLIDPAMPTPDSTSAGSFFKNPVVPLATIDRIAVRLDLPPAQIKHWPVAAHPESNDPGGTVPSHPAPQQGTPTYTKLPAAWLIERAGFPKGHTLGPVGISTKHTLALTNRTGLATCRDLLALRDQIVRGVEEAFGITLEQEPVFLS